MRWRLFATLAEATGETTVEAAPSVEAVAGQAEAPDAVTVGDALDALLEAHPALEAEIIDEDGDLADHVRLLVDGTDPRVEGEGLDEPIDADAELALFPPVSGG
ncbi:MAG: ubiquitin-like small modifier protein 1 [Haloarculaceae archaeon]